MMILTSQAEVSLAAARRRLAAPCGPAPLLPALLASSLLAVAALGLAGAVILGPPPALAASVR